MDDNVKVSFWDLNKSIWGINNDVSQAAYYDKFRSPGALVSWAFPYLFSFAGLILFVMLIWGAMEIFLAAGNSKLADSGKKRITAAFIGFLLLFASFWIGQIIQAIFGIDFGLGVIPAFSNGHVPGGGPQPFTP